MLSHLGFADDGRSPRGPTPRVSRPRLTAETEAGQVAILCAFYAKHDTSKTEKDVVGILVKRKKEAAVLPVAQFEAICGKLSNKYKEAPIAAYEASFPLEPEPAPESASAEARVEAGLSKEEVRAKRCL